MSDWSVVFLGVMAGSLLVMAAVQIGLIVVVLQLVKRVNAAASDLKREVQPLIAKASQIADEAGRATALAAAQVERVDRFMAATSVRVDDTLGVLQGLLSGTTRQGTAFMTAFRTALAAFRYWQDAKRRRPQREEEEALFVG